MPCVGYICPVSRDKVPFDHFDICNHGPDGHAAASPWLSRYAAKKIEDDIRHSGFELTTTRCMSCPRETYLKVKASYHVNPEKRAAADRGTALHSLAAQHSPPHWITENTDPVRCTVQGTLFDAEVSGLIDAVIPGGQESPWTIVDWKFTKDGAVFYRHKFTTEFEIQMNINRLLLAQQPWAVDEGYDPKTAKLVIWHHAIGKTDGPVAMPIKHMTEQELLNSQPYGGAYTIYEIVEIYKAMAQLNTDASDPSVDSPKAMEIAAAIPLVGQAGMMNGDKCTMYCDVEPVCSYLVREYGLPGSQEEI